jgi:hypothetical protein
VTVKVPGVTGVIEAYAKPICNIIVPFPCIEADLKCDASSSGSNKSASFVPNRIPGGEASECPSGTAIKTASECAQVGKALGFKFRAGKNVLVAD